MKNFEFKIVDKVHGNARIKLVSAYNLNHAIYKCKISINKNEIIIY